MEDAGAETSRFVGFAAELVVVVETAGVANGEMYTSYSFSTGSSGTCVLDGIVWSGVEGGFPQVLLPEASSAQLMAFQKYISIVTLI